MAAQAGISARMEGPLAPSAGDLRKVLAAKGYSLRSASELMRLVSRLSCWLEGRGLTAGDVTAEVIDEFFLARRTEGCGTRPPMVNGQPTTTATTSPWTGTPAASWGSGWPRFRRSRSTRPRCCSRLTGRFRCSQTGRPGRSG